MDKNIKILLKILKGFSDANIDFNDLRKLLLFLDFEERIKGSHHIFSKINVEEIINIQSKKHLSKSYQVRQVRNIILIYKLGDLHE